jgi:lysozyme
LTRIRATALLVVVIVGATALAMTGVQRGWWRPAHPDRARWPRWGVDVSHHQGAIDWRRVAADPQRISFAYVKATEGGDFTDPRFRDNWEGARAAGLRVGAYHFFTFCRPPREQAAHFVSVIKSVSDGDLAPAVDVEYGGNCKSPPSREAIVASLREWLAAVREATGRAPVVYATSDAWDDFVRDAAPDAPLWLRSLWREPREAALWQFAHRAHVDGITGFVDLDAERQN